MFKLMVLGTLIVGLLSCSTDYKREKVKGTDAPILSQDDAEHRAKKVSEVEYDLFFDISAKKEFYTGVNKITFKLNSASQDLRIDFSKGSVRRTLVNGTKVQDVYNKHYLLIPSKFLKSGENEIEVHFTQSYSRDGSGYYRFTDPEDNKIYTYTDLEPYDANKVFPCFDQPNLKAKYKMYVKAPKDWHVETIYRC